MLYVICEVVRQVREAAWEAHSMEVQRKASSLQAGCARLHVPAAMRTQEQSCFMQDRGGGHKAKGCWPSSRADQSECT